MSRKAIISVTLSDYLIDRTGTPKVVMSHQRMANDLGLAYFCLFPIGSRNRLVKRALSGCFGLIEDGVFQGVCSLSDFFRRLQSFESEGGTVSSIHIHHLMRHSLETVEKLLSAIPDVPISVFLHDYYLCCSSYNLVDSNGGYCGGNGLNSTACLKCTHFHNSMGLQKRIWALLSRVDDRISFICPSETVRKIFLRFHPEYRLQCEVVPHQVFHGAYMGNLQAVSSPDSIRIAYLGSQLRIKGWNVWTKLVAKYKDRYDFIIFNNQKEPRLNGARRIFVEYSSERPDAMIRTLRNETVDIAIMWSSVPETYSYTCMEAFASNVYIITDRNSGNIADFVSSSGGGIVLDSTQDLFFLLQNSDNLLAQLNRFKSSHVGGPLELLDNDKVIATSVAEGSTCSLSEAFFHYSYPHEVLTNPLKTIFAARERRKIVRANK